MSLQIACIERRRGMTPGHCAIETDGVGERPFTSWRGQTVARTLFAEPGTVSPGRLRDFDLIFVSGITTAILPDGTIGRLVASIDSVPAAGGRSAYDSNHRPVLRENAETTRPVISAMWSRMNMALPSLEDERMVSGDASEADVLTRLCTAGCAMAHSKCDAAGPPAIAFDVRAQPLAPADRVANTTAAGDGFNAGFPSGRTSGLDVAAAMRSRDRSSACLARSSRSWCRANPRWPSGRSARDGQVPVIVEDRYPCPFRRRGSRHTRCRVRLPPLGSGRAPQDGHVRHHPRRHVAA